MSVVRLHCPECDKRLKLMAEPARQGSIVCPRCSHRFTYGPPSSSETVAVATVPAKPARPIVALLVSLLAAMALLAGLTAGLTLLLQDRTADPSTPDESVPPPVPAESTPVVPTSVPPSPPVRPPDPPWVPREVQTKVHAAIERGVAYLRKQQQANGSFSGSYAVGLAALPGLALLECGVRRDDPAIQKAAAFLRAKGPRLSVEKETYELSLVVLFLDRLGDPADRPLIRDLALRLVAGQRADGGWSYDCGSLSDEDAPRLAEFLTRTREPHFLRTADRPDGGKPAVRLDPAEARRVRQALPGRLRELPVVRATLTDAKPRLPSAGSDNSNTQFATLALWAARRHEAPVERSLELVGRRFRLSQSKNGAWGYTDHGGSGTPAMTGVGLLGLAVGHGVSDASPTDQPGRDPDIDRGLAALAKHLGEPRKDGKPSGEALNLYFLWTVERVGVLYKLRAIGGKEWYPWGAQELLPRQKPDGSWSEGTYHGSTALLDTCLALLFLSRANLTTDLSDQLERIVRVR